ncbi:MAG: glycosyltransferase family 4 protein [Sandaracinaceae bacterium]|nr:glycosyltransferase family 4 protein [Sandaracinaceae bacterium]
MRVGMLTTSYPRLDGDASGAFVRAMARALAARGHRLEVLAPRPASARAGPPDDAGVEVTWVDYAPDGLRATFYGAGVPDNVRSPRAWPGLVSFPYALHREAARRVTGWDALVSHWALPSALVAGRVRGERPHLAVLHSADVHLLARVPGRATWATRVAASASELLFASAEQRARFLDLLPARTRGAVESRAHASAMGIEAPQPAGDRRALRRALGLDRFTVLSLGRLVPIKGVEHAIDAVRGLDGVELVIAGDGPSRAALEARGPARFVGAVAGRDKAALFAAVDAFVVPSAPLASGRTEGTPTAALEAARAGLPIVASALGGLAEVFAHERSALLVRPRDALGLRRAFVRLRDDARLRRRLGRAAIAVGRRYEWPVLAPHLEALLGG